MSAFYEIFRAWAHLEVLLGWNVFVGGKWVGGWAMEAIHIYDSLTARNQIDDVLLNFLSKESGQVKDTFANRKIRRSALVEVRYNLI